MVIDFFPSSAVILQIGAVQIRTYGLMYVIAAFASYFLGLYFMRRRNLDMTKEEMMDIVFWGFFGGIVGARIFYGLVYNLPFFLDHPLSIFAVWNGGLSIHGGLIGGALSVLLYIRRKKLPVWEIAVMAAVLIPLGMMLGRIGNFANGELYGRATDVAWGMDFGDGIKRHPSQLYAVAKDLLLFLMILALALRTKIHGKNLFGILLVSYAILRFFVEFFREPDVQLGFIFSWLTMGQILSFFVLIAGILFLTIPVAQKTSPKQPKRKK